MENNINKNEISNNNILMTILIFSLSVSLGISSVKLIID